MEAVAKEEWIESIVDDDLRHKLERAEYGYITDDTIRAAFVLLERRIRQSAGLSGYQFGKELIDAAFHPETGLLQPVSPVGAERSGLHHLLLGIFLYYRNPIAHRSVYHDSQAARQICFLIDHALGLIRKAAEQVIKLEDFVGDHEGQRGDRRDFRLDIDDDGEEEVVVLVDLGPVLEAGKMVAHHAPIILKKGARGYSRVPCEKLPSLSMFGLLAEVRYITRNDRPDIVVSTSWGETMRRILILRYETDRYVLALREIPAGMKEPYYGPHEDSFGSHGRQMFSFADVDGDGCAEMIHTLLFDDEDEEKMGYGKLAEEGGGHLEVCRVWKWDDQKKLIVQIEERPVIRR